MKRMFWFWLFWQCEAEGEDIYGKEYPLLNALAYSQQVLRLVEGKGEFS